MSCKQCRKVKRIKWQKHCKMNIKEKQENSRKKSNVEKKRTKLHFKKIKSVPFQQQT